jgi:hypothetical protein
MRKSALYFSVLAGLVIAVPTLMSGAQHPALQRKFQTSDRCLACHNGITTSSGEDVSIGIDWRSGMMANSSRDPYWQASVRRETIDHPESRANIEDVCSTCHMPMSHYEAKWQNRKAEVFSFLSFDADPQKSASADDGVSCSVCHQISRDKLGTRESFNGQFVIDAPKSPGSHPEYGPFAIQAGQQRIMQSSTGGFHPTEAAQHIRDSALCGSCHTLITETLGEGGNVIGSFPEQMPYLEWLHSDYPNKSTCQSCHMPEVHEAVAITAVLGVPRQGVHRHTFVAANFFVLGMLNRYRQDLNVAALPEEFAVASEKTIAFLQSESARVSIRNIDIASGNLQAQVFVQNLSGHKLPTAYPSRRAWLHVIVKDRDGHAVFESGALNLDGSIQGNDNDADSTRFEPHYREITRSDQVEIYEPILKDSAGGVTTGLLKAVGYLKDNRLLPSGFRKDTAENDIAVVGEAADDSDFTDAGSLVRYSVPLGDAQGPFHVEVELWYQPIGFRWAHNLAPYDAAEPRRFVSYYESIASSTAVVLARAEATR